MTPASALDRSDDLLLCILDFLSFPDLLSMSMVNKHIHSLTEAHLYSTIETTWALGSTPPVTLLLRSILDRPQLSSPIRSLRIVGNGFGHNFEVDEPLPCPLSTVSTNKASEIILSTGVPHTNLWINELQSGTVDAIVATLLITTANLKSLYLGPNFTIKSRLIGSVFLYALCKPLQKYQLPTFQNLRQVTFSRRGREYFYREVNNTSDVLPFFYLPELQHLSISLDNPYDFVWPAHTPTPSSLESLEIYRLREAGLMPLLQALKGLRLRKLHWHWFYQPDLDRHVSKDIIELDTIAKALNQVHGTLTDLTIGAAARPAILGGDYEPPPLKIRGSLDGMVHLGKLRSLSIPWVFLMGFSPMEFFESSSTNLRNALSPSLEVLTLTADLADNEQWEWEDDSIVSAVKSELESRTWPHSTCLRHIELPIPLGYGKITDELIQELRSIGANARLDFGWTRASRAELFLKHSA
ncbi:hypothetical protein CDD83_5686 [Cordyceps sp. RAO-2017]|nr:hypothetical protein CDD83_5686 [Cordyceps sp. RAO-2017]